MQEKLHREKVRDVTDLRERILHLCVELLLDGSILPIEQQKFGIASRMKQSAHLMLLPSVPYY